MRLSKQQYAFIGCDGEYESARTVVFGAPYDGTSSYRPGSRFAPAAIRAESFGIETYSPYSGGDLGDYCIFDGGDLELPFGCPKKPLQLIESVVDGILADKKVSVMLGGEHLVTLGALRAAKKHFDELCVIQLDAHCDLREQYIGEELSHATVMRRCWELLGDGKIFQHGIRSGERDEFLFSNAHTTLYKNDLNGIEKTVKEIGDRPVYFTLDLDVLDPSELPGTGTPEAGGVSFFALMEALDKLKGLNIIGCDINELCPIYDPTGRSVALSCKILRELLILLNKKDN